MASSAHKSPVSCYLLTILLGYLFFLSSIQTTLGAADTKNKTYTKFVKTSCNSTTYPSVCVKSLSVYASSVKTNPLKLCNTALSISLQAARDTSTMVSKLSKQEGLSKIETAIIKDCVENIEDCIDELRQSVDELGHLGGSDVEFQMSNIKTWVSAAITDESTCTDGFEGTKVSSKVKNQVRKSILKLAKLTSNALALINGLNY